MAFQNLSSKKITIFHFRFNIKSKGGILNNLMTFTTQTMRHSIEHETFQMKCSFPPACEKAAVAASQETDLKLNVKREH